MEDIIKSIKATLYERTGNPFLFSFSIAWCIHNFRLFIIVLSDESLNSKLVKIDSYFDSNLLINEFVINYGCILHAVIAPLLYALVYIYVFPFFSIKINGYHFRKQKELLSAKQNAEELELLTIEKSRELRKSMVLLEAEFRNQVEKLEEENNELKNIIKEKEKDSKINSDTEAPVATIRLSENEKKVLINFAGVEYKSFMQIANNLSINLELAIYICDELELKKLVSKIGTNNDGDMSYSLTHLGRKYLIENSLI